MPNRGHALFFFYNYQRDYLWGHMSNNLLLPMGMEIDGSNAINPLTVIATLMIITYL